MDVYCVALIAGLASVAHGHVNVTQLNGAEIWKLAGCEAPFVKTSKDDWVNVPDEDLRVRLDAKNWVGLQRVCEGKVAQAVIVAFDAPHDHYVPVWLPPCSVQMSSVDSQD